MNENTFSPHLFLEGHRKRYEQGHKDELLGCLVTCMLFDVPIPRWLRSEFVKAHLAVMTFEKSWNDVFGRPLPKRKAAGKGTPGNRHCL